MPRRCWISASMPPSHDRAPGCFRPAGLSSVAAPWRSRKRSRKWPLRGRCPCSRSALRKRGGHEHALGREPQHRENVGVAPGGQVNELAQLVLDNVVLPNAPLERVAPAETEVMLDRVDERAHQVHVVRSELGLRWQGRASEASLRTAVGEEYGLRTY